MISILIQNEYVLMVSCGVARASGCPASRSPHTPGTRGRLPRCGCALLVRFRSDRFDTVSPKVITDLEFMPAPKRVLINWGR